MPPKAAKKKEEVVGPQTLPAISPALTAAQIKFDKWVKRVQELVRAKSDAIRLKSSLVLSLREADLKLRAIVAEAEAVAYKGLRPPPTPVVAVVPVAPLGNSKVARKVSVVATGGKASLLPTNIEAAVTEVWKEPEEAEKKRLQRVGDQLMTAFSTKRGGPEKVIENEKPRKGNTFKRKIVAVDAPSSLAVANSVADGGDASATFAAASPLPSPKAPDTASAVTVASAVKERKEPLNIPTPPSSKNTKVAKKGGKQGGKKDAPAASEVEGIGVAQPPPPAVTQMVSLSLAAGSAVIVNDAPPVVEANSPKGGRTPRGAKGAGKKEATTTASSPPVTGLPPIGGTPVSSSTAEGTGSNANVDALGGIGSSFKGVVDGLCPHPLADGMEKPKAATFSQWHRILELRQERLDLEDSSALTRESALEARNRVQQLKEMESIARYSLNAAQSELEALTGVPIAPIVGITSMPVIPQPPGTPRPGGGPSLNASQQPNTATAAPSPEASPTRSTRKGAQEA